MRPNNFLAQKAVSTDQASLILLVLNIMGAGVYLIAASRSWAIPQEKGLHTETGEPFTWALSILPIATVFLLINLMWGAFIVVRRQWQRSRWWLLTCLIWLAAVFFDFAHH